MGCFSACVKGAEEAPSSTKAAPAPSGGQSLTPKEQQQTGSSAPSGASPSMTTQEERAYQVAQGTSSVEEALPAPSGTSKQESSSVPTDAESSRDVLTSLGNIGQKHFVGMTQGGEQTGDGTGQDAAAGPAGALQDPFADPALRNSPGCFSHSLKLLHGDTLSKHNIQLCRPAELVSDIKEMSFIGNGSFAAVFKGSWQGAKVAIKFVVSDSLTNNSVGLRESVLSQLLSHPNVIQTYTTRCAVMDDASLQLIHGATNISYQRHPDLMKKGFVSGDGFGDPRSQVVNAPVTFSKILLQLQVKPGQFVAVVIMEYADKGTLQDAIYKRQIFKESPRWNKRIAARALFRTAREIAIGMQHLHNCNVLHGDLKPGNVLLTSARVDRRGFIAKLTDFGLSHVAPGPIATNTWGTLRYMAPEHFQGTMSRATDVYAFGMLLWEMVSGKKPYEDMHQGEIIQCVSQGLRPVWPQDCFPHLEYLGKRCLAHHPDERPTFGEIVKEIEDMEVMLRDLLQQAREGPSTTPAAPSSNSGSFTAARDQTLSQEF